MIYYTSLFIEQLNLRDKKSQRNSEISLNNHFFYNYFCIIFTFKFIIIRKMVSKNSVLSAKILISVLFTISVLFNGCSPASLTENQGLEVITPNLIQKYMTFLASDSLKGRGTPSPELDTTAAFIAWNFRMAGLSPVKGSYFQKVHLGKVSLGEENQLKISSDGKEKSFTIKDEFVPFEMTANKSVTAPIVFVGYGITSPDFKYDDYKDINVRGKIVFMLKHEPGEEDSSSVFNGKNLTQYSEIKEKVSTAIENGAIGIMIATDPLNHSLLTPRGFPWPSLSKIIPKDALPITLLDDEANKVPVVQVGGEVINLLFGSVEKLKQIQAGIDKNTTPNSFEISDCKAFIKTSTIISEHMSNNVIGLIEGSDPNLKEEVVIVGAHYDHVGYKKNHKPDEDYIYNGADDNASGTAAVMALAKAFGSLNLKPKRSMLFITFVGEELGLLGSQAYVNNPLLPLQKTVAMLNFDMVGRNSKDNLYIVGASRSPDLAEINKEENEKIKFKLSYNLEEFLGRSDQASFLKKAIPILFYTTGEESEYHKVTDEVNLIDFNKESRVVHLSFLTALHIANDNHYYKIIPQSIPLF
jgi:hypothetical protein